MKTKEELNALKEEVVTLNKKLRALNEEELAQVTSGVDRAFSKHPSFEFVGHHVYEDREK